MAPLTIPAQESRVLSGLARLAGIDHQYADLVRSVLDLLEDVIQAPLICLSLQEDGEIGHYARAGSGADSAWVEPAARQIADAQERWLAHTPGAHTDHGLHAPWFITYPAWTRSGRQGALAVSAPESRTVSSDEERLLRCLAEQVMLVLDHALLLEQIEQLETTDRLTGTINLRRLLDVLQYELQRHQFSQSPLSLLIVDVEGLRTINRSYGRNYGNHILRKLAQLIHQTMRPIDVVARCGLDEFAVLMPETDEDQAMRCLQQLRERLLTVEFAGGEVGLSVAVVTVRPEESVSPEQLLRRGARMLYEAKRQQHDLNALLANQGR